MKILLIGEFSRLHNSLKEGLLALGHEVVLVNNGDGFKRILHVEIKSQLRADTKKNSKLNDVNTN